MNPDSISPYSDKINHLVAMLVTNPRAIAGFFILVVIAWFLKWKWFYIPAVTIVALAATYHYTFARAEVGAASPNLGFFLVGIFIVVIIGTYYLLIKE